VGTAVQDGTAEERESAESPSFVRVKIGISYDGTEFSGWAVQPGQRTVAGVLAEGLERVLRLPEPPRLTVAGRTDAGVHARGQVAHMDVPETVWAESGAMALRRLAGALPPDVRVRSVGLAPDDFDARFSALWRRYSYRVCDDIVNADPLRRKDTLWHLRSLDLDAMNTAAGQLLGEHDFAAFCKRREGATTVRALRRLDWRRDDDGIAVACVVADAFCYNMVRSLMGVLLPVGEGARPPEWPVAVLTAGVRDPGVRVAPPHPLCLEEVRYPDDGQLAERVGQTRQVRTLGTRPCQMPAVDGLPVTIRSLRAMLTVSASRSFSNWVISFCWAELSDEELLLSANCAHMRIT
jgi:tRNA pseudouridine38-40 synthase